MENLGAPIGRAGLDKAPAGRLWMRLWLWGESAWRDFLYLILPAECVVCGREDQALCPACSAVLRQHTAEPFRAEQRADALVEVLGRSLLPVVAAGVYRDALAETILAFKNHGRTELAAPLSRALSRAMSALLGSVDPPTTSMLVVVPVPSTGSGWRRRGYDPVAMILRAMEHEGRLPAQTAIVPLLGIKAKPPWRRRHQKGLGRADRRRNVRNTMKIRRSKLRHFWLRANPDEALVVVVDDVLTTGSTLQEAVKTLENAGLSVYAGVVLAAARAPEGGHELAPRERLD